jgi:Protein of unknown function (DUF1573)
MRHSFLAVCSLLVITSFGWAGAESCFNARKHDFGATPRGSQLTHYFPFTNNSRETLTIGSLRVSCGCVVASAPVAHIKPGESSYITAQMDTRKFIGHKVVTIYVDFIAPQREEVTLLVKANGRDDFSIYPESLAFGNERKGSTAKASIQATFRSGIQVDGVKCDSDLVKVESKRLKRTGAEATWEITATLGPDLPVGRWRTDVWLQTNSTELAAVRVPLSVEISAAVTASPEVLELGEVRVGDSVEQNVLIRGDKPFKIKSIRGAEPLVQVSGIDADAKKVHVLKFAFKPSAAGEIKRSVGIVIEDGDEPAVTIPLQARAIKD